MHLTNLYAEVNHQWQPAVLQTYQRPTVVCGQMRTRYLLEPLTTDFWRTSTANVVNSVGRKDNGKFKDAGHTAIYNSRIGGTGYNHRSRQT